MPINYVLSYFKDEILENFISNGIFKASLQQNQLISDSDTDESSILNGVILTLQTGKFLEILKRIDNNQREIDLFTSIKKFNEIFQEKIKILTESRYELVKKNSYDKNSALIKIKDIYVTNNVKCLKGECFKNNYEYLKISLDIFKHPKFDQLKRILIKGNSGIGKTYDCVFTLYFWATEKDFLSDYIIFCLNLHDYNNDDDIFEMIYEQNFKNDSKINKELIKYIFHNQYEIPNLKILIFLDHCDDKDNDFCKIESILSHPDFRNCQIIIWARPSTEDRLEEVYDAVFELIGFQKPQIEEYFKKYFGEVATTSSNLEGTKLYSFVKGTTLFSNCKVPLMSSMIVDCWKKNRLNCSDDFYSLFNDYMMQMKKRLSIDNETDYQIKRAAFVNLFEGERMLIKENERFENFTDFFRTDKRNLEYKFIDLHVQTYLTAEFISECMTDKTKFPFSLDEDESFAIQFKKYLETKNLPKAHLTQIFLHWRYVDIEQCRIFTSRNEQFLNYIEEVDDQILQAFHKRKGKQKINFNGLNLSNSIWAELLSVYKRNITHISLDFVNLDLSNFLENTKGIDQLESIILKNSINDSNCLSHIYEFIISTKNLRSFIMEDYIINKYSLNNQQKQLNAPEYKLEILTLKNCEIIWTSQLDQFLKPFLHLKLLDLSGNYFQG